MTLPRYQVLNVAQGDDRYDEVIGQVRADPQLRAQMWSDAEHGFDEAPGKVWTVVVVRDGDRWVPAAWAAATVRHTSGGQVLFCSDNYERRGAGRRRCLYRVAYRHRHATVVAPSRFPALTYLFAGPCALHEADGWCRTGRSGTSREPGIAPHDWWELRRPVDPPENEYQAWCKLLAATARGRKAT